MVQETSCNAIFDVEEDVSAIVAEENLSGNEDESTGEDPTEKFNVPMKSWPLLYQLPSFSKHIQNELSLLNSCKDKTPCVPKSLRCSIVNALYNDICTITM